MARTALVAVGAAAALAAGSSIGAAAPTAGPSAGVLFGGAGVAAPGGAVRYVTLRAGAGRTVVAAIRTRTGLVARSVSIRGTYGVPVVAFSGQTEGVTRDGGTLLLAGAPGAARGATEFALIDTPKLKLRRLVEIPGSVSYDALAPDGRTIYVIEYLSSDQSTYRVRAFDLRTNTLVRRAIADPGESGKAMNGFPAARATSGNGAWVYTLYGRPESQPFVHALDTVHRRAVCVDLPWRTSPDALLRLRMTLRAADRQLVLLQPGVGRVAVIDTTTYAVRTLRRV